MKKRVIHIPKNSSDIAWNGERFVPNSNVSVEIMLEHLHRYLAASPYCIGKQVLDIACGEGYGSYILSQVSSHVAGVDNDYKTVAHAQQNYKEDSLTFTEGCCTAIPHADDSFDVVVSFETLEHIEEHEQFLNEVKRVLRSGGVLIISTPNIDQYNELRDDENPFHRKELNRMEFEGLLANFFTHQSLGGQASLFASNIFFDEGFSSNDTLQSYFHFFEQNNNSVEVDSSRLSRPAYHIALASDNEITVPINSIYEGDIERNILSALQGGIDERDQWLMERDQFIDSLNRKIEALNAREQHLTKLLAAKQLELEELEAFCHSLEDQGPPQKNTLKKIIAKICSKREG